MSWMMIIALIGFIILIAIPIFLARKLFIISRTNSHSDPYLYYKLLYFLKIFDYHKHNMEIYGSFYSVYVSKCYYWELIITFRRLCTALLIAFVPNDNPVSNIMLFIYFIVQIDDCKIVLAGFFVLTQCYLILQIKFNPHVRLLDSIMIKFFKKN